MIEKILKTLTLEDMVGQLLCYDISPNDDPSEVEKVLAKIKPGGLFLANMTAEQIRAYTDMANKYTKVPVIIASDVEHGPEIVVKGTGELPLPMAWGACNDEALIACAGEETAKVCRKNGVHWTFAPVVDLNMNFRCPECNIRAVSDDPDAVIRIAGAYLQGIEKNGLMVAGCKHFPGQGTDERNSHFCTTENRLSKEEWMDTYGYVYKEMIKKGAASIMIGHGALPAYEAEIDPLFGAPPAILSKSLMTELLKGELGFDGCLVSDAMSMVGATARSSLEKLAVRFINAGGDMVLFPEPTDFARIHEAVLNGEISKERLQDAVKRVLKMKFRARLFENQQAIAESIEIREGELGRIAQEIADKSIKIVRDTEGLLPVSLKKGSRILFLNMLEPYFHKAPTGHEFDVLKAEFEKEGHTVDVLTTAKHKDVANILELYDLVLLNCKISSRDYHGATLRVGWNNIMVFWRGYVLQHPKFVFVSFGDPYKLFDFPYLKEYVNAFSFTAETQKAVAKVIMGKMKAEGKNPVDFPPYFTREI